MWRQDSKPVSTRAAKGMDQGDGSIKGNWRVRIPVEKLGHYLEKSDCYECAQRGLAQALQNSNPSPSKAGRIQGKGQTQTPRLEQEGPEEGLYRDGKAWLAGILPDVKDQRYIDKVFMHCGENNPKSLDCYHEKLVFPRTLMILLAKQQWEDDIEEEGPPIKQVSSASGVLTPLSYGITPLPHAVHIALPELQTQDMNVITDGEEFDIRI